MLTSLSVFSLNSAALLPGRPAVTCVSPTIKRVEHHITVPRYSPLKIGTLNAVLKDIAAHLELDRQQLIDELFKK